MLIMVGSESSTNLRAGSMVNSRPGTVISPTTARIAFSV
jgi:hypothetical protein